jgi:hypothetical protein
MTRGRDTNEAFIVTSGEQTAVDVFTQCITTDWIDRPAHARRAELYGETVHRPGLLDGDQLRAAIEHRHDLHQALESATATGSGARSAQAAVHDALGKAKGRLAEHIDALTKAGDVLDRYDRALHRRRHVQEINEAQRAVSALPAAIDRARSDVRTCEEKLTSSVERIATARHIVSRRHEYEAAIDELDDTIAHDLRTRTRIARLEQPDAITDLIGPRPRPGGEAHEWDAAAGRIAQHQAAFELEDGIGPYEAMWDDTAFGDSYRTVQADLDHFEQDVAFESEIRLERPGLGIDL